MTKNLIKTARHKCNMRGQEEEEERRRGVGEEQERVTRWLVRAMLLWGKTRLMIAINPVTVGQAERQTDRGGRRRRRRRDRPAR